MYCRKDNLKQLVISVLQCYRDGTLGISKPICTFPNGIKHQVREFGTMHVLLIMKVTKSSPASIGNEFMLVFDKSITVSSLQLSGNKGTCCHELLFKLALAHYIKKNRFCSLAIFPVSTAGEQSEHFITETALVKMKFYISQLTFTWP